MVIAVIGPNWLTSQNATGESRLAATDDWVREELAYALDSGIDLIPVLVRGATPPTGMDLPTSIAKLANIQHFELSDSRFRQEVTLLGTRIEDLIFSRYDTVWLRARLFAGLLHRRLVRLLLWGSIGAILGATI